MNFAARLFVLAMTVGNRFATGEPAEARDDQAVVIAAPGRVEGASDILALGSAGTGVVASVEVEAGDRVKQGQVLARLD